MLCVEVSAALRRPSALPLSPCTEAGHPSSWPPSPMQLHNRGGDPRRVRGESRCADHRAQDAQRGLPKRCRPLAPPLFLQLGVNAPLAFAGPTMSSRTGTTAAWSRPCTTARASCSPPRQAFEVHSQADACQKSSESTPKANLLPTARQQPTNHPAQATTESELTDALQAARGPESGSLCFIECLIHKDDCSAELLEWGARVSAANARPPASG